MNFLVLIGLVKKVVKVDDKKSIIHLAMYKTPKMDDEDYQIIQITMDNNELTKDVVENAVIGIKGHISKTESNYEIIGDKLTIVEIEAIEEDEDSDKPK